MAEILLGGKRLTELKVTELKVELEKRGLQKKGVKSVLIERLKKAILEEALTTVSSAENTEEEEAEAEGETEDTSALEASQTDTQDTSQTEAVDTTDNEPEVTQSTIKSPTLKSRKKKRRSRKWSASKGEAPAAAAKEKEGKEPVDSATEIPPASGVQELEEKVEETVVEEITVDTGDDVGEFVAPLQVDETEIDVSAPEMELQPVGDQENVEVEQHEVSVEISIEEDVSEIDVEGTPPGDIPAPHRETSAEDEPVAEPMDLVTPLDTDIECQFEVQEEEMPVGEDSKVKEDGKDTEESSFKVEVETDSTLEKVDKESLVDGDVKEKKEEEGEEKKAIERLDSVLSFQPDAEELLYEGDVENEQECIPEEDAKKEEPTLREGEEDGKIEEFTPGEAKEDGFIVDLHGDSMEIDEGSIEAEKKRSEAPGKKTGGEVRRKTAAAEVSRPPQCHLWVSGLVPAVRALDLQTLFSPFGRADEEGRLKVQDAMVCLSSAYVQNQKVISAKVVAKARSRAQYRYGYVTMATPEQAQRCIQELNNTELKGRTINVEVAKSQPPISQQLDGKSDSARVSTPASSSSPRRSGGGEKEEERKKEITTKGENTKKGANNTQEKPRKVSSAEKGDGSKETDRKDNHSKDKPSSQRRSRSRSRERRRKSSPIPRRTSGLKRRSHSPPRSHGRIVTHHSHAPHTHSPHAHHNPMRGDARHEIMRREFERRELERRLGGDPYLRERERQVELRLEERRLVHDRHQEMLIRRQLQVEHTRREQDMLRRMQESREREARERERQMAEQERLFKERERELREREYRERQRREQLERELREREARERDIRERERRLKEQHERELREREAKSLRERELREKVQAEKERELRDRERKLALEQERIERERRLHMEQQRRLEQERARVREHEEQEHRERERKLKEEREQQRQEQERRERQEQERRERQELERRERERREREEERAKRDREQKREREEMEREKILQHPQRLGKRPFGGDITSYESAKRQAVHDLRGASDSYSSSPSSVFGRLDPPTQNRSDTSIQPLMARPGGDYRRSEQDGDHSHSYERPSRGATGSLYRTSGYSSRERHSADGSVYPLQEATSRTLPQTANVYGKVMSGLSASSAGHSSVQQLVKQRQSAETTALSRVPTEIINAATQALENIRKSVASAGGQVPGTKLSPGARIPQVPSALPPHFQQLAASAAAVSSRTAPNFLSINPRVALSPGTGRQGMLPATASPGATVLSKYSPQVKLPPEDERYNNPRRFSRPGGHQRPSTYKRLI